MVVGRMVLSLASGELRKGRQLFIMAEQRKYCLWHMIASGVCHGIAVIQLSLLVWQRNMRVHEAVPSLQGLPHRQFLCT
jgi:hypothetical protein